MEYKLILGYFGIQAHKRELFFRYHPTPHPLISVIENIDEEEKNILHRV